MSAFGRDTRMRLTARQVNAGVVIAVEGALTASTARQFLRRARGLLAFVETPRVAIDLSGVPRVDASGGAALIALLRHVQSCQGDLCLFGLVPGVRLLMEIMQMHLMFDIAPNVDGAVEALAVPSGASVVTFPRTLWSRSGAGTDALERQATG